MRRFRNVYIQSGRSLIAISNPCYGVMNVYALKLMIITKSSNSISNSCHRPMCCVNPPYAMFPGWMVEPTTFLRIKIHGVESWRDQPGWFLCTYRCNEKYDDVFRQTYSAGKYHHNNTKWNL
jgi:hypothetical protein